MTRSKTLQPQTIAIDLERIGDLFNAIDPTPFPVKDLDNDVEEFIRSWAREYPERQPLKLVVHLRDLPENNDARGIVSEAVHHYYAYRAKLSRLEFSQLMKRGRTSLIVGLVFMTSCLALSQLIARASPSPIAMVAREGLVIGGWVAMWRPLEILLYDWWPLRRARRIFEKLSTIDVAIETTPARSSKRSNAHGTHEEEHPGYTPPRYRRTGAPS